MTSPLMEAMLNVRAFSVQHLLDLHDYKGMICHLQQQQQPGQQVDDAEVADPVECRRLSQIASAVLDDPLTMAVAKSTGACVLAGGQMSLTPATTGPSRNGRYADMPDLVQASYIAASCCHQDSPYNTRLIQSSASHDYYSGLHSVCLLSRILRKLSKNSSY